MSPRSGGPRPGAPEELVAEDVELSAEDEGPASPSAWSPDESFAPVERGALELELGEDEEAAEPSLRRGDESERGTAERWDDAGWADAGAPAIDEDASARTVESEAADGRRRRRRRGGRRRRRERTDGESAPHERFRAESGSFAEEREGLFPERETGEPYAGEPYAGEEEGDLERGAPPYEGGSTRPEGAVDEEEQLRGEGDFAAGSEDGDAAASKRRRRRRRRRRTPEGDRLSRAPFSGASADRDESAEEGDDEVEASGADDEGEGSREAGVAMAQAPRRERDRERRRGRRRRGREVAEDEDEDVLPPPQRSAGLQRLVINCVNAEESRVALVADGILDDIQVNVRSQSSYLGNIYKGRVVNLEPSIGAAFIDFGVGRNGFLHVSDVMPIYGREGFTLKKLLDPEWAQEFDPEDRGRGEAKSRLNITDFLKKGQEVLVQITKDGIGEKGPTLTTFVSIPGRYLVLMPSLTRCGVSRKIEDERERRRLRRILKDIETPPGMGVIVRTAGSKRSKEEIRADLEYLMQLWKDFSQKLATGRAPKELYEESDVALRTIRDIFTPDVKEIAVDDEQAFERICAFMNIASPGYVDRVKLYKGPTPIFHAYGVESQLEQLFARKVELPNGGSIVIDQAEALVAIDVNSGKSKESGDLEQTALRTNLAAIPEIARQMRLRDLGGIVVIDFIDMMDGGHRRQVERAFRAAIANDRARTKLTRISQFGLLEMTRQRLGPGLKKTFFEVCPHCQGMGHIKTPEAQSLGIIRDIQAVLGRKGFQHLEVKVRPEVEEFLANQKRREIFQLEERYTKRIRTVSDYRLPVGQVHFRFLTEDGREVRPSL